MDLHPCSQSVPITIKTGKLDICRWKSSSDITFYVIVCQCHTEGQRFSLPPDCNDTQGQRYVNNNNDAINRIVNENFILIGRISKQKSNQKLAIVLYILFLVIKVYKYLF